LQIIGAELFGDSQRIHKQPSPTHSESLVYASLGVPEVIEFPIKTNDVLQR
jgi:hypothetical protein